MNEEKSEEWRELDGNHFVSQQVSPVGSLDSSHLALQGENA